MKKRSKIAFIALIASLGLFAFSGIGEKYFEISKSLDIFSTLFKEVNTYYVDEVDPKKLVDIGINSMLQSLDPYTDYIPEEELEAFTIQTTGQYAGIGALIVNIHNKAIIRQPYIGFPAYRAGVKVGDEIISINGNDVKGKPTIEVSELLKGKPKTEISLLISRPGLREPLRLTLVREKIRVANVAYSGMMEGSTGYIKLDEFMLGAGKEVEETLINLKKEGAKSIILDLRENPGGSLYEAVNIVNLFIPKDREVVSTKGKMKEWNKTYHTLNPPADVEIPLVILVGEGSASASEIVAGALQDYDRAVLVGQKTFGKGLVQTTRELSYQAQLKVTTAKYYIPSGRCIQALDYSHRKSDGTVEKFADSLKSEFKTKNGRKVYDGAGLDPDRLVEKSGDFKMLSELVFGGYLFEYATEYCSHHSPPTEIKSFKLKDSEYDEFVLWTKKQSFHYTSDLEKTVGQLTEEAKSELYYDDLKPSLNELRDKLSKSRSMDFERHKATIVDYLEQEIGFHYGLHRGRVEVSMDTDVEMKEAIRVLVDAALYRKLLSPN